MLGKNLTPWKRKPRPRNLGRVRTPLGELPLENGAHRGWLSGNRVEDRGSEESRTLFFLRLQDTCSVAPGPVRVG